MNPTNASNTFLYDQLPDFLKAVTVWLNAQPIITALLMIMMMDVVAGICRAVVRKTLSSTISWRGMSRKVFMLLLVGVAAVLEPFAGGLPLTRLVSIFYLVTESLSILENAAAAGVPLPKALIETLAKLRALDDSKALAQQFTPPQQPQNTVNVNLPKDTHIDITTQQTDKK